MCFGTIAHPGLPTLEDGSLAESEADVGITCGLPGFLSRNSWSLPFGPVQIRLEPTKDRHV